MFDSACKNSEMYQIPYIEHELRIFKAYHREKLWKGLFIGSNCLWVFGAVLWLLLR